MILILKILELSIKDIKTISYDFEDFMIDLVFLGFCKFVITILF